MADGMSKGERDELRRVNHERARLAKHGIEARMAELLADVEEQISTSYAFDDGTWTDVTKAARRAIEEADAKVAEVCAERGIRPEFRPRIDLQWYGRGVNGIKSVQIELRRLAKAKIEAEGKRAKLAIDTAALERREMLAAHGLESAEALEFMASMPTVEALMPKLDIRELEAGR